MHIKFSKRTLRTPKNPINSMKYQSALFNYSLTYDESNETVDADVQDLTEAIKITYSDSSKMMFISVKNIPKKESMKEMILTELKSIGLMNMSNNDLPEGEWKKFNNIDTFIYLPPIPGSHSLMVCISKSK